MSLSASCFSTALLDGLPTAETGDDVRHKIYVPMHNARPMQFRCKSPMGVCNSACRLRGNGERALLRGRSLSVLSRETWEMATSPEARGGARPGKPWRLLAGLTTAVLGASLLVGTGVWWVNDGESSWFGQWALFSVWAAVVGTPGVLLFAWPLDIVTAKWSLWRAAGLFALLGLLIGAAAGAVILGPLDVSWLGASLLAPAGAITALVGRCLVDVLVKSRFVVIVLFLSTVALVAYGALRYLF